MKIVCISDTHNQLHRMLRHIPDGDVLVHAGDLTMRGTLKEVAVELQALAALPHRHKILVAGNHDWLFQRDPATARSLVADVGVIYLEESGVDVEGVRFWGSPWQPEFGSWAFNYDREDGEQRWSTVPDGTDVLVTHGPPFGYGDETGRGEPVGCVDLLGAVRRVRPRYHVFGHIHEGHGTYHGDANVEGVTFVNAATLDETYRGWRAAGVVEIEPRGSRAVELMDQIARVAAIRASSSRVCGVPPALMARYWLI